jgi:hypothetical protein
VGLANSLSRFGHAPRFLGPRRHPPNAPHPHGPTSHPPLCLHAIPLRSRSPRGILSSLGFAHPWGTSGRQQLRPRRGRRLLLLLGGTRGRLLRRTGTASSRCSLAPASAASSARCCCATSPAPPSWPRAGPSAGTRAPRPLRQRPSWWLRGTCSTSPSWPWSGTSSTEGTRARPERHWCAARSHSIPVSYRALNSDREILSPGCLNFVGICWCSWQVGGARDATRPAARRPHAESIRARGHQEDALYGPVTGGIYLASCVLMVVGFLMLMLAPARSYPERAGYVVAEIGWFLHSAAFCFIICPALSVQWRSTYAKLKED